ncbi:MAG: cysteine hydrolase family protein [Pseudomonadota bacterium]
MNALLLIDIQLGFNAPGWGTRNNPDAEARAGELLAAWRAADRPIVHICHVSKELGSPLSGPGTAFKPEVMPRAGEKIVEKSVNSAFIGTNLHNHLQRVGATDLTICGLTTPHCVSTTTRMAGNLNYNVRLVADACAAFTSNADVSFDGGPLLSAEEIHRTALAHLHGEFAEVCIAEEALSRAG